MGLTDKQRVAKIDAALVALKKTTKGYTPNGVHWRTALARLEELRTDLARPAVPNLGPIVYAGKSILLQDCTHITDGLGWPAFDDGFKVGLAVVAPEPCVVDDNTSSAQGGDAFYVKGDSGIRYWVGHITTVPALNRRFRKGEKMTTISGDHPRPHVHLGIDARALLGKHLESHSNYTHGAALIGVQLAKGMR
jgi:hypothetical protein